MIDPEIIPMWYAHKPAMSLSGYGQGALEFTDETINFKEKGIDVSEMLLHGAQCLVAFSPEAFIKIDR